MFGFKFILREILIFSVYPQKDCLQYKIQVENKKIIVFHDYSWQPYILINFQVNLL